jgi:hypothetical protein
MRQMYFESFVASQLNSNSGVPDIEKPMALNTVVSPRSGR